MLHLSVKAPNFEFGMDIKYRLSVITGYSGVGKTTLFEYVTSEQLSEITSIVVSDNSYIVRNGSGLLESGSYVTINKSIYIFDESRKLMSSDFANIYNNSDDCFFIVICRDSLGMISYPVESVYEYKCNGSRHWVETKCNIDNIISRDISIIKSTNCVILEDSGLSFDWFSKLINSNDIKLISSFGKANVVNTLEDVVKDFNCILLIVDWCSYGCHIVELLNCCKTLSNNLLVKNVLVDFEYRCFEYLLLSTRMIRDVFNYVINKDTVYDLESYYELEINGTTNGTIYVYRHGNNSIMSKCYYEECCPYDIRFINSKGGCYVTCNDKFSYLLTGTEFEYLLLLRR